MTPMMQADEIASSFNATTERQYWRAEIAGTRALPCVHFNSRSSMVRVIYWPLNNTFTVTFTKVSCAFGDFMASAHRSLEQVLIALKATGYPFAAPLDGSGVLRCEFDPATKAVQIHMAKTGDDWLEALPLVFKVPEKNIPGSLAALSDLGLDVPEQAPNLVSVESDNTD